MPRSLKFISTLLASALLTLSVAQADDRVYTDQHSVWSVSFIETYPGHFDDYIADLNSIWKQYLDAEDDVLSYKMIPIAFPRDGEPNLMLMVEYKNWAAFDKGNEYYDKLAEKLQGGIDEATESNVVREKIRDLRGGFVGREIKFKEKMKK